jgi:hypothetical protein
VALQSRQREYPDSGDSSTNTRAGRRHCFSSRWKLGYEAHRVETDRLPLSLQPLTALAQEQEPGSTGLKREAEEDWRKHKSLRH